MRFLKGRIHCPDKELLFHNIIIGPTILIEDSLTSSFTTTLHQDTSTNILDYVPETDTHTYLQLRSLEAINTIDTPFYL